MSVMTVITVAYIAFWLGSAVFLNVDFLLQAFLGGCVSVLDERCDCSNDLRSSNWREVNHVAWQHLGRFEEDPFLAIRGAVCVEASPTSQRRSR